MLLNFKHIYIYFVTLTRSCDFNICLGTRVFLLSTSRLLHQRQKIQCGELYQARPYGPHSFPHFIRAFPRSKYELIAK